MEKVGILRQAMGAKARVIAVPLEAGTEFDTHVAGIDHIEQAIIPKIGHPALDDEHKHMLGFAMFCVLTCPHLESRHECEGCATDHPVHCRDGLHNVVDHLLPFIQKHFDDEENLMRQARVDEKNPMYMAIHLSTHNNLLHQFRAIATELSSVSVRNNIVIIAKRLHDMIMDKLVDHIHRVDMQLIPYLADDLVEPQLVESQNAHIQPIT